MDSQVVVSLPHPLQDQPLLNFSQGTPLMPQPLPTVVYFQVTPLLIPLLVLPPELLT